MRQCLGDEHPVERVSMGTRQSSGACCMFYGNWQLLEILPSDGPAHIKGQYLRVRKFTEPMFGGDLPSRRSTDQYVVAVVRNRPPCRYRQATIPGKPPDERMGVEQEPQYSTLLPRSQFLFR